MARKPGAGRQGSVSWNKSRERWEARLPVQPNGKRPSKFFLREREGWSWIARVLDNREVSLPDESRATADFLVYWLATQKDRVDAGELAGRTYEAYSWAINIALEFIGSVTLADLKPDHIQSMLLRLRKVYAAWSVRGVYRTLRTAFSYAEDNDVVARNPMRRVKPLRLDAPEKETFAPAELAAIFQASVDTRWLPLWVFMASTGVRIGEALGLKWKHLDLDAGVVEIRFQCQHRPGGSGYGFFPLKTAKSKRDIALPPYLVKILRTHRSLIAQERLRHGDGWDDESPVFCNYSGGLLDRSTANKILRDTCDRAGVPRRASHTFRHTVATFLGDGGLPLPVISELLGHSDQLTTQRIYSHATQSARSLTMEYIDRWVGDLVDTLEAK